MIGRFSGRDRRRHRPARGAGDHAGPARVVQPRPSETHESTDMSADKDRGIRRIRQKRAKALKRLERPQRSAGTTQATARTPPARQPA